MPPDRARRLCYNYLKHADATALFAEALRELGLRDDERLVARLFLTSSSAFKRRKLLCLGGGLGLPPDVLASLPVDLSLPHFIWVTEVAPVGSYRAGRCIAEVVLDASESENECEYIYMRIGKKVLRQDKVASTEGGLTEFPQYTHNLGERGA